jgi:hypothetical protein
MLDDDILAWLGNFINFMILIYLTLVVVNTGCFDFTQLTITAFGLLVSITINIYTSLSKKR